MRKLDEVMKGTCEDGGKAFESVVMSLTRSLIPGMVGISRGGFGGSRDHIKIFNEKGGKHLFKRICHASTHHEIWSKL